MEEEDHMSKAIEERLMLFGSITQEMKVLINLLMHSLPAFPRILRSLNQSTCERMKVPNHIQS